MSNILDLFRDDLSKVNFDISGTRCMYEKIKRMQQSVGGTPHITAKVGTGGVNMFILSNGNKDVTVEKFSGVIIQAMTELLGLIGRQESTLIV